MSIVQENLICALATPPGEGGVAVVRASGRGARALLVSAFRPARAFSDAGPVSHHLYYGKLLSEAGEPLDEVLAVYMASPHSYTREDVAEFHLHGGRVTVERCLARLAELGARPAEPGEFTKRAYLNGRLDLSQAEAVMQLIQAGSEAAARASLRQLEGGVSRFVEACQHQLTEMMALIAACTDYPEEVEEAELAPKVAQGVRALIDRLEAQAGARAARIIREGVSVALVGRPNVGKSSLLNRLLGHARAIVTDVPGTTRDVLSASLVVAGLAVELMDTAGQREAGDPVEAIGVERARHAEDQADAVVVVLDSSRALTPEDEQILNRADGRYLVALNKADLPAVLDGEQIAQAYGLMAVPVSARTGGGVEALLDRVIQGVQPTAPEGQLIAQRHLELAQRAVEALGRCLHAIETGLPLDLVSADLWEAWRLLGGITGNDLEEAVIDRVFERFCVGK